MEAAEFQKLMEQVRTTGDAVNLRDNKNRKYTLGHWPQGYWSLISGNVTILFDTVEDLKDGWIAVRNGWHTCANVNVKFMEVSE